MAKTLTVLEVETTLRSGRFDELVGGIEDEHLECKGAPYQLEQDHQKMELAKDVSALANADGGILLIGPQTERDPGHLGDEVRRVSCFAPNLVDTDQYHKVLGDWVYPPISKLRIEWHASATNRGEGIVSIIVPLEATQHRPFLVVKLVEPTGKNVGSFFGYFERTRTGVNPTSVERIRDGLKDGLRFSELDARLQSIEEAVGKLAAGPAQQGPTISQEAVELRVDRARHVLGLEGKPALFLAAWPLETVVFPTLFESRQADVVKLLENPTPIRNFGFDLATRRQSEIVAAKVRRTMIPGRKLLELWRDGVLIFVAPGDEWHLCWGMRSDETTGLRINNLAVAETTYLFVDLALKLYAHSVPQPERLNLWLGLKNMTSHEKPCSLHPYRPNELNLNDDRQYAPGNSLIVQVEAERGSSEVATLSYRLLADLYNWFGFDADQMPYVNRDDRPPRIDPTQIR